MQKIASSGVYTSRNEAGNRAFVCEKRISESSIKESLIAHSVYHWAFDKRVSILDTSVFKRSIREYAFSAYLRPWKFNIRRLNGYIYTTHKQRLVY